MKSVRRHELQTNSLVRGVQNFPTFWRESGSKILLVVIAVLLVFVLVRLWFTSRTDKANRLASDLTTATSRLTDLRRLTDQWVGQGTASSAEQFFKQRKDLQQAILTDTDDVLKTSSDPAQQAEAKLIRADLNYFLAE